MTLNPVFFMLLVTCSLTACSGGSDDINSEENIPTGVIPQGQLDALEKAGGVSDVLEDADAARRRQLEEQGI